MMISMLDLEMSRVDGYAMIAAAGSLKTADDSDTLSAAMSFVPVDDHLVIDLRRVERISLACARSLCGQLLERVAWAEAVVVTDQPDVTVQLVLGDVDRVAPVVASVPQAIQVITARSGFDATEVA